MKEDQSYGIILLLKEENKFLILRQVNGHWSFPKGHKEGEESPREAALRELAEESGITDITFVDCPVFQEEYTFNDDGIPCHKFVDYFVAFSNTDMVTIQEKEILDYKWATYEEALELFNYPEPKKILEEVKNSLKIVLK